jgi:hypothetical protein
MVMSEEEKKLTAYHEAGHAIVGPLGAGSRSRLQGQHHPARPRAGRDHVPARAGPLQHSASSAWNSQISSLFGGRVSPRSCLRQRIRDHGASNDIERATDIARNMVTKWGLSERLGPLTYSEEDGEVFLGRSVTQHKQVSDDTARVDRRGQSARSSIATTARAKQILRDNIDKLHTMAEALIKYETIDAKQIDDIMAGRPPREPGQYLQLDAALRRAEIMVAQGAALVDVGGESTRPGAAPVSVQEELDRVLPVVERLARELSVPISVDTSKPELMRELARAGAGLINDVRALQMPGALAAAVASGLPVCLMHLRGEPITMQRGPVYADVVAEVRDYLAARVGACEAAGIARERILVDPGFGFGKIFWHRWCPRQGWRISDHPGFRDEAGLGRRQGALQEGHQEGADRQRYSHLRLHASNPPWKRASPQRASRPY